MEHAREEYPVPYLSLLTGHLHSLAWRSRQPGRRSQKVSLHDVLLHHALGIEKGAIECDGVAHDIDEALPVAIE